MPHVLTCSHCGARAPALAPGQTGFACTFCGAWTALEPSSDVEGAHEFDRALRIGIGVGVASKVGLALLGVAIVAIVIVPRVVAHASGLSMCAKFSSTATSASWSSCPDEATHAVSCAPTFGKLPVMVDDPAFRTLRCDCLTDGVTKWFFTATSAPPLASRPDAERVAKASCEMW